MPDQVQPVPPETSTKLQSFSFSPKCAFGFATDGESITNFSSGPFPNEVSRACGAAVGLGFQKFRGEIPLRHMTTELELTYLQGRPDDEFTSQKLDVPLIQWSTRRNSITHFFGLQWRWSIKEPLFEWRAVDAMALRMGVGLGVVHARTTIRSDSRSEPYKVNETLAMGAGSVELQLIEWRPYSHWAFSVKSAIVFMIGSNWKLDDGGFGFRWELAPEVRYTF